MTEWEQMKKEYRDVQIPASGPHQMLETIAKAKRDRRSSRIKQAVSYSTVVAAVLLVVLLIPGIVLFSGGFASGREEVSMKSDMNCTASTGSGQESTKGSYNNAGNTGDYANSMSPVTSQNKVTVDSNDEAEYGVPEFSMNDNGSNGIGGTAALVKDLFSWLSEAQQNALCEEISRQLEERRQQGETYYTAYDTLTEAVLLEGQSYYIREDGLLVILYAAGIIAPESQGEISFVIPKEIINVEEKR